jgi:hypothetical protein
MRLVGPATALTLVGAIFGVTLINEATILLPRPASLFDESAPGDLQQELFWLFILTQHVRYPATTLL